MALLTVVEHCFIYSMGSGVLRVYEGALKPLGDKDDKNPSSVFLQEEHSSAHPNP